MNSKRAKKLRKSLKLFTKDLNNEKLYMINKLGTITVRKDSIKGMYKELKKKF